MTRKNGLWIGAALVLFLVYAVGFTDWFHTRKMEIKYRANNRPGSNPNQPVMFFLDRQYPVTSLKVVLVAEARTNQYPHALWSLVAETNGVPVTDFNYGASIPGMKPAVPGMVPESLKSDLVYRLVVKAGKLTGQRDFKPNAALTDSSE